MDLIHNEIHQPFLEPNEAGAAHRTFNGRTQLFLAHGPEEKLCRRRCVERRKPKEFSALVFPHNDDDSHKWSPAPTADRRESPEFGHQVLQRIILPITQDFLKLIDDKDDPVVAKKFSESPCSIG